jgi:hypothetical protein
MNPEQIEAKRKAIREFILENFGVIRFTEEELDKLADDLFWKIEHAWGFDRNYQYKKEKFEESISEPRGLRYHACSELGYDLEKVINALKTDDLTKNNLQIMRNLLLRMILSVNDGHVSIRELHSW